METTKTDKPKNEKMQQIAQQHSKLSITINQMKRAVTRFARQNQIDFAWQTRFHDHIIQNNDELNTIAQYIENNVVKWHDDKLNNNNFVGTRCMNNVETRQWHVSTK